MKSVTSATHALFLHPVCPRPPFSPFLFVMLMVFIPFKGHPQFCPPPPSFSSNYSGECIWSWISFSPSFFCPLWLLVWGCLNVPIWTEISPLINFSHVHFYFVSEEIKQHVMEMKCPALNMIPCWLLQASRNCPALCFWSPIVVDHLHTNLNKWNLIKNKKDTTASQLPL